MTMQMPSYTDLKRMHHGLPLPQQMRLAADTLEAANIRHDTNAGIRHAQAVNLASGIPWDAIRLREAAARWEAVDKEATAKEELTALLAATLIDAGWVGITITTTDVGNIAATLIAEGWKKTKGDT